MASVYHISDEDAARDFKALVARVRAGEEVVVEEAGRPVVVMRAAQETFSVTPERRSIAEARELLKQRGAEQGLAVGNPEHAAEMEAVHAIYKGLPVVSVRPVKRTLAEAIALGRRIRESRGTSAVDDEFGKDMESVHEELNQPMDGSVWD